MRGGKRAGAGRKKGSATKKTRAIAEQALAGELPAPVDLDIDTATPLEVMLAAMRLAWGVQRYFDAAEIAKTCAPYLHPKLSAVEHTGKDGQGLIPKRLEIVFVKSEQES